MCAMPYADTMPLEKNSYAVPQEVGRVGVESPTFIEPVEKRKDGIEALFSRQTAKGTTPASSPQRGKRKRESSSPPVNEKPATTRSVKTEPINVDVGAASDDSEVEILSGRPPVSQLSSFFSSLPLHFLNTPPHHRPTLPAANRKKGKVSPPQR